MTFEGQGTRRAEFSCLLGEAGGEATAAILRSIVAPSRRHREHRLKPISSISIVLAVAGASVAGISRVTNSTTSASKPIAIEHSPVTGQAPQPNSAWTKQHHPLGAAPKVLKWSKLPLRAPAREEARRAPTLRPPRRWQDSAQSRPAALPIRLAYSARWTSSLSERSAM